MLNRFREWRNRRLIDKSPVGPDKWAAHTERLSALAHLDHVGREALRRLAVLFLHDKQLFGAHDARLTDEIRLPLAAYACLPILRLGLDWYRGWHSVIVYPDEFVPEREYVDEDGIVHYSRHPLAGEAWEQGPVLLSWDDVRSADRETAYNVVLHEMAHKLDMLNGGPNGQPPLHRAMNPVHWQAAFQAAYADLCERLETGAAETPLDPYAAESPGEFFAVASEAFFENPGRLFDQYPAVYNQLVQFYRQQTFQEAV